MEFFISMNRLYHNISRLDVGVLQYPQLIYHPKILKKI